MPLTNGPDAARIILQISRDNAVKTQINRKSVKIIAASAYTDLDSKNRCLKAGMIRYLNKPLRKIDLAKTLFEIGCLTIQNLDL